MNADDINSAVTDGNIELEKVLKKLATDAGSGLEPMTGNTYVCIKTTNENYTDYVRKYQTIYKNGNERIQTDFTVTLALLGAYDTVILSAGDWTGNYATPLNATAPFCRLLGLPGSWMGATTQTDDILDVWARGWEIAGIEFDNPTTSGAGINLTKIAGLTKRADFVNIHDCLFYGGQIGIDFAGGGTYWKIHDNQFSLITVAGGAGIYVSDSSYQIPALGLIENNRFDNSINHIDGGTTRGFNDTVIRGNVFQQDGNGQNASILCDIRGGGGGNQVVGNFFDVTKAQYTDDAATAYIRTNATDFGAGNHCSDGEAADLISV